MLLTRSLADTRSPQRRGVDAVLPAFEWDQPQPSALLNPEREREAIAYYQTASHRFAQGLMTHTADKRPAPSRI